MLVEVEALSKRFGGLQAVDAVSLVARGGAVTAVIGPNGAGKSTLLDCLSGITPFDSGEVRIDGVPHRAIRPQDLVAIGITRTFQHIRLFESLTALDHLALARHGFRATSRGRGRGPEDVRQVCRLLLARVGLEAKAGRYPSELSYGERRRLEIARGLAVEPRLFLIDEPAAGSTPSEQVAIAELIGGIAASGTAVILVEHHMELVARVSQSVVVLNFGRVIVTGTIAEVRAHPEVISAYLGTEAA